MRQIQYLSPSSISIYNRSKEEFYITYLADVKAPRLPQNVFMAIGSAFDAYVKSFLHQHLFGKDNDPKFALLTLFEAQVEIQNRDKAFEHGKYCFEQYKKSGALADLMLELEASKSRPMFEFEVRGDIGGVILLGKPDLFFINRHDNKMLLDFKVNNFYGKSVISPMRGYIKYRPYGGAHKDCYIAAHNGTMINMSQYLDETRKEWAEQLSIYGWLLGCEVGEQFIVAIDQIIGLPAGDLPEIRVAEHRLRIRKEFQEAFHLSVKRIWEIVHSDHYYREMSKEESQARCQQLETRANTLANPITKTDVIFNAMTRG